MLLADLARRDALAEIDRGELRATRIEKDKAKKRKERATKKAFGSTFGPWPE